MRTLIASLALLAACGPPEAEVVGGMTTSASGITAFVKDGKYKTWTAEAALKNTSSPHGQQTRVFWNDVLEASLRANNTTHPKGSIAVKEFYTSGVLGGHTVSVKVAEGTAADTVIWFEGTAPGYANPPYGKALATCVACHKDGRGFVFSSP